MTQQLETPAPFGTPAGAHHGAPPAGTPFDGPGSMIGTTVPMPPSGLSPADWRAVAAPPRRSTGRVVGLVVGIGFAALVALVAVVLLIGLVAMPAFSGTSTPAPAAPAVSAPAVPSAAPAAPATADRQAVQQAFDAAGLRLDHAHDVLGTRTEQAGDDHDLAAFRAAAADFSRELAAYRTTVTGLDLPADQQGVVTDRLLPALDATATDTTGMATARSGAALQAPAGAFDRDWKALADLHNQVDRALAQV